MAHKKQDQFRELSGAGGGKGGGGRVAVEAANTLSSRAIVKVVEVLSEGPIVGIAGGAQGIYINNTPLQNSDGSYNFARASWDYRVGLPSQDYMQGFPSVEAEFVIGTQVTTTTPLVRSSSAATVDAVRVTIGLPQGLSVQDTKNGDLNGSSVTFAIDTKLTSSGTWTQYGSQITIDGKTVSPTEKQYRIDRPSGGGGWDVRVRRISADATLSSVRDQIAVSRVTEVQDIKLSYNDTAYVGISIDAETVGGQIPSRSYMVKGLILQVPSNYDPITRVYTGQWDGTFKNAWTDNPAWALYSLLTHTRFGMGEFITAAQIDKFSFYDAAVYSDQLVPNGKGGTEPRFTFNVPITERNDAYRWLSMVAGAMRCTLLYYGGLITLLQDRPSSPKMTITKANVIDGLFEYKSTGLFERHTAFNVTFNDREDRNLQRVTTIEDAAGIARYGYNPSDIAAFGATTEGQAIRFGKWALDTELNQTEMVAFKMGLNGQVLKLGQVFKLADNDYTVSSNGGRVVSVVGTTVALDRPITVTTGSTIDIMLADGQTMESRNIVSANGTFSSVTVNAAFSQAISPQAPWVLSNTITPRQFKVMGISQTETNIVSIEAIYHDPNKYNRVEQGINVPAPVFTASVPVVCTAPTSLLFKESATNYDNTIRRSLQVGWQPPLQGTVKEYNVRYRSNSGVWVMDTVQTASYTIDPVNSGAYNFEVSAVSIQGMPGPAATGTYTIQTAAGGASSLAGPTILVEQNGNSSTFLTPELSFKFTNPTSNGLVLTAQLRDFEVRFIDPNTSTTIRTVYVPPVDAGAIQSASYSFAQNLADAGGVNARRSVKVEVRCRDTSGNLSSPASTTFVNAAPPVPSNLSFTGALQSVKITMTLPTDPDFKGILVWMSTQNGFTPSSANIAYDGSDSYIPINALSDTTPYYFRVAAYDTFGKAMDGSGLNLSAQQTATTSAAPGLSRVASLPASAVEGDTVVLTTDGKLYIYHAGAWNAKVPTVDLVGQIVDAQITGMAASKIQGTVTNAQIAALDAAKVTGQLVDSQVAALAAGKITGTLADGQIAGMAASKIIGNVTNAQIAALDAAKVTGQLVDTQIAAVAAAKVTGTLATTQIGDNSISTSKLQAGSVIGSTIAGDTILGSSIKAGQIGAGHIAVDAVNATHIQANAIGVSELAAGSVTVDKLVVTSQGQAINPDPHLEDIAHAWGRTASLNIGYNTGAGGASGGTYFTSNNGARDQRAWTAQRFTIDPSKTYKASAKIYNSGSDSSVYVYVNFFDVSGAQVAGGWGGAMSGYTYGGIPPNTATFTECGGQFGAGVAGRPIPGNVKTCEVGIWLQYSGNGSGGGEQAAQDIRLERANDGSLIVDGAVTATKIAANTITGDKIAGNTITGSNIVGGTITAGLIGADAINASHIQAGAVGASEIAAGSITGDRIAGNQITGTHVVAGTLTGGHIAADSITGAQIAANTITASELAADSVTAGKIQAGSIGASQIAVGSLTGDRIAGNTLTGDKIQGSTITGTNIQGSTITADKLNIGYLSAVSASIGTLRTASSGGRMEFVDNQIRVYDASNVLRVVIGAL